MSNYNNLKEIEKQLVKKKDWLYTGEVDNKKRPINSLLNNKSFIDFDVAEQFEPISSKQNLEIQRLTLQRLRERTFDNHSFDFKEEIAIEEENILDMDLNTLFNEIESELLKISDYGSIGFLPDVKIKIQEEKKENKTKIKSLEKVKNVTVLK